MHSTTRTLTGNKLVSAPKITHKQQQTTISVQLANKEQTATVRLLDVTDPATKRQKSDNVTGDLVPFGDNEVRQPIHSASKSANFMPFPPPVLVKRTENAHGSSSHASTSSAQGGGANISSTKPASVIIIKLPQTPLTNNVSMAEANTKPQTPNSKPPQQQQTLRMSPSNSNEKNAAVVKGIVSKIQQEMQSKNTSAPRATKKQAAVEELVQRCAPPGKDSPAPASAPAPVHVINVGVDETIDYVAEGGGVVYEPPELNKNALPLASEESISEVIDSVAKGKGKVKYIKKLNQDFFIRFIF